MCVTAGWLTHAGTHAHCTHARVAWQGWKLTPEIPHARHSLYNTECRHGRVWSFRAEERFRAIYLKFVMKIKVRLRLWFVVWLKRLSRICNVMCSVHAHILPVWREVLIMSWFLYSSRLQLAIRKCCASSALAPIAQRGTQCRTKSVFKCLILARDERNVSRSIEISGTIVSNRHIGGKY